MSHLLREGGLTPMTTATDWVSPLCHTGAQMACALVATADARRGGATCRVGDWSLGGSREELVAASGLSDHRPLSVSLLLGP